jgi:Holliday junction resolvasome RuvABC endonuclease subunit
MTTFTVFFYYYPLFFTTFNYQIQIKEVNHIKLLSIDQSTVKSGWSIFIDNIYFTHGLINLSKLKTDKFEQMCIELTQLILKERPDIVVFEDVALQTNVSTLRLLAQLQGIIMGCCIINNIEYITLKPTTWRKVLQFKQGKGVKRKDLKIQSITLAKQTFNLEKITEDEADALCIGLSYIQNKKLKGESHNG